MKITPSLNLLIVSLLLIGIVSCKEKETPNTSTTETIAVVESKDDADCIGGFAHNVYFWLKNPESETDRTAFLQSLNTFIQQSPYIQTKFIGEPSITNREVIDTSYTFSLVLTFKDKAAQDAYQEEAAHKTFIAESEMLWEKVLVYDSEVINLP